MSCSSGSDGEWDEKTLTKTSSNLSESDLDYDKPNNKQQSSLFIHKLYEMATCDAHAHIFGFSEDGMSLKIRSPANLGPVLLRYFKHSNTSSFIRQLNNYGFKTISSVSNGNSVQTFAHPYFHREGKDMLDTITRKTAKNVKKCKGDIIKELQHVETEYRKRFRDMESKNQVLQHKNEQLVQENKRLKSMLEERSTMIEPQQAMVRLPSITCNPQFSFMPMFEQCPPEPLMLDMAGVRAFGDEAYEAAPILIAKPGEKMMDEDIISSLMDAESANAWPFAQHNNMNAAKTEFIL